MSLPRFAAAALLAVVVSSGDRARAAAVHETAEAPAGSRSLVVVVNRQRPEKDVPLRTLVRLFRGEQHFWDNGDRVYPVLPPDDHPELRDRFLVSIVKLDSRSFALLWKNLVFRGDASDPPVFPPDERHAVQSVFAERGAIALVEGTEVKNLGLVAKILTVNERARDAPDYPLKW